ncbi:UNVERIFIED_CONTAM: hypothetical protein Sangu_1526300 [Sesamum angustifolium]|uniref:Uncharacterized protein n=1 Tax=Sesamum angustifolium TaxID=2727405 RepID=A0AAW2MUH9_9LAMI
MESSQPRAVQFAQSAMASSSVQQQHPNTAATSLPPRPSTTPAVNGVTDQQNTRRKDLKEYLPLHRAALKGNWEAAKQIFDFDPEALTAGIDLLEATALHTAIRAGKAIDFVEKLIAAMPNDSVGFLHPQAGAKTGTNPRHQGTPPKHPPPRPPPPRHPHRGHRHQDGERGRRRGGENKNKKEKTEKNMGEKRAVIWEGEGIRFKWNRVESGRVNGSVDRGGAATGPLWVWAFLKRSWAKYSNISPLGQDPKGNLIQRARIWLHHRHSTETTPANNVIINECQKR